MKVFDSSVAQSLLRPPIIAGIKRGARHRFAIRHCAHSDAGLVRIKNQDAWKVGCGERFFTLADGIGGRPAGEIAAQSAVETFCQWMERESSNNRSAPLAELFKRMQRGIEIANTSIFEMGCRDERRRGMGTTLCSLYLAGDRAVYAHVGDSRIYHWRAGLLRQLTRDHTRSRVDFPLWAGSANSPCQRNPMRAILTRALGVRPGVMPAIGVCDIRHGDRFLLCSDGLSDFLAPQQIERALSATEVTHQTARSLIASAKDNNSRDNITAVLIQVLAPSGTDLL